MSETARGFASWAAVIGRWTMGVLFVYMGLSKALDPVGFLKLVREYHFIPDSLLLNLVAATLPWFEVICGVLLLLGVAVRGTALLLLAMLMPFTALVLHRAIGLMNAQGIAFCAVKFDCGCGAGEVYICHKLIENSLLVIGCAVLVWGAGQRWCLRHSLLRGAKQAPVGQRP